jgi:uroporphyrinogen-III decarboxylase
MIPEITLDAETYLNVIAGKPVKITPEIIATVQGRRCKLVNGLTKTYMFYKEFMGNRPDYAEDEEECNN